MDPILFVLIILAVGAGVGVVSAALGVGGGVLMVPAFLYVFPDMDMNTAKGSSLLAIVFVAGFNSWRMNRGEMKNPWSVAAAIAAGAMVGGFAGGWLTGLMSDAAVTWVFVGLLAFSGIRSFFLQSRAIHEEDVRQRKGAAALIGLVSGLVAGATGTGGGAVLVPLVLWAGLVSNERVVALSNTVMAATAAAGTVAHFASERTMDTAYTYGLVNVSLVPVVVIAAIAAAPVGRWINGHLSLNRRRVVMGTLLLVIAARLIYRVMA